MIHSKNICSVNKRDIRRKVYYQTLLEVAVCSISIQERYHKIIVNARKEGSLPDTIDQNKSIFNGFIKT